MCIGYMQIAILYEGLEHPLILVTTGVLEPIPRDTKEQGFHHSMFKVS